MGKGRRSWVDPVVGWSVAWWKCVFDAPQTFIKWFAQFGKSKRLWGLFIWFVFSTFCIDFAKFYEPSGCL